MTDEAFKRALFEALPDMPDVPLAGPPAESFDLTDTMVCPACGGADARVQMVDDAEVAKCPQCGCEFPPVIESVSRQVIRRISEHRERRLLRVMEMLPARSPIAGIDPDDYAVFREIVNDDKPLGKLPVDEVPAEA